jgi:hypothetical protein
MMLRWKKHDKEIGLCAVGAGPHRASDLRDQNGTEYATVYPDGGNWMKPLQGWYYVSHLGGYVNTCGNLAPDEATAKAQAAAYVKAQLKNGAQPT